MAAGDGSILSKQPYRMQQILPWTKMALSGCYAIQRKNIPPKVFKKHLFATAQCRRISLLRPMGQCGLQPRMAVYCIAPMEAIGRGLHKIRKGSFHLIKSLWLRMERCGLLVRIFGRAICREVLRLLFWIALSHRSPLLCNHCKSPPPGYGGGPPIRRGSRRSGSAPRLDQAACGTAQHSVEPTA